MTLDRTTRVAVLVAVTAATLGGCVVAPAPVRVVAPVGPPPGVAVVGPTYPIPAPGYVWLYNPRFGYGWHHPQYGWHRGWR